MAGVLNTVPFANQEDTALNESTSAWTDSRNVKARYTYSTSMASSSSASIMSLWGSFPLALLDFAFNLVFPLFISGFAFEESALARELGPVS